MFGRMPSKEDRKKIKKYLNASFGFIYGTVFGVFVFPVRAVNQEIWRLLIPEIKRQPLVVLNPINILKAALYFTLASAMGAGFGLLLIGGNTARAWYNKGWKAWASPNRLITEYLISLNHPKIDHIIYLSNDELLKKALKKDLKRTVANAISTTNVIKKQIDDSLKQNPHQECKNFPIEASVLIMEYIGVKEVPGCTNEKTAQVIKKQLNLHIQEAHLASRWLGYRLFSSCFKPKESILRVLENKEEGKSAAPSMP